MVISTYLHQELKKIECWWSFLTKTRGNWWKHSFLDLETEGVIDMTSAIDKEY